ncbi:MAG TPA: hypothetical protein VGH13_24875 [Xanthobacteraceae bacterium]|jgi:hypothetical protein
MEFASADDDYTELIKEIVREILLDLRKAGYRPDQPRWPRGSGDISGRWSGGAGEGPPAPPRPPPEDLPTRSWSIGHNQGPPLDDPPDIPTTKSEDESEILDFAKAAARWLGRAGLRRVLEIGLEATVGGPVGDFLLAMEAAYWLSQYLPYIYAYLDAPKTWEELQQNQGTGYDNHHVVEQWSRKDGIPDTLIDADDNQVPIPTLKHWDINGWLDQPNEDFRDAADKKMSPRQYLKGKSWEERRRVGIDALIQFGVLKP